jgi:integral membrane protein (TIGR01906 family)
MHIRSTPLFIVHILKTLIILLVPVALVLSSVRLLVTDQYLAFEYSKADFPLDPFGFAPGQRLAYASENYRYVREDQPIEALTVQRLGDMPLYNERELQHMQDVQNVYELVGWVWQIASIVIALAVFTLAWRAETRPALAAALKWGGLLTIALIGGLGLLAVVAWQFWFVAFHQIFFAPGTWTFNQWDTLIQLFPNKFWFDAALTISGLSLIGGLLAALIGWVLPMRREAALTSAHPSTSQS